MPTVLFGISGSIAAYKAHDVIRSLVTEGVDVIPIISKGGAKFVTATSIEALAGRRSMTEIFPENIQQEIEHIMLAGEADLLVTCPASADIIAKYANGIADDPLALIALAFGTPHLIAPAMNHRMWDNPATKQNVSVLEDRGIKFIGPDKGLMACGEEGWGRLAPPDEIHGHIMAELGMNGPLAGRRVVVTAGATVEPIDVVRYLSNNSSGRMGHALAEAARDMGARVILVTASELKPPSAVTVERVIRAEEMREVVMKEAEFADAVVMAAAVADFAPVDTFDGKIKKDSGENLIKLELKRTPDILNELGKNKRQGQVLVGFAAEFGDEGKNEALRKLKDKQCDLICLNDISRADIGFGSEFNEVTILYPDKTEKILAKCTKVEIAKSIMAEVSRLLDKAEK
jgi:phosphopantothenoylcysteine decarboxylase/phosphopantothenate--cysteine ligase